MSKLVLKEIDPTTVDLPASGTQVLYLDQNDNLPKLMDSAGNVLILKSPEIPFKKYEFTYTDLQPNANPDTAMTLETIADDNCVIEFFVVTDAAPDTPTLPRMQLSTVVSPTLVSEMLTDADDMSTSREIHKAYYLNSGGQDLYLYFSFTLVSGDVIDDLGDGAWSVYYRIIPITID